MTDESPQTSAWLSHLREGNTDVLAHLFAHYRPRLRQMLARRMDARVAARLDASDVLQEVYLDAARQLQSYLQAPGVPFYVWLRGLAWERLLNCQRQHLGTQCRDAQRELHLPDDSSDWLAQQLLAPDRSPCEAALQAELRQRVREALNRLDPQDREVLLMRHLEGMSNNEVATALGLSPSGATMRYGRALRRLKAALAAFGPMGE
jgi:RNA polymerase sigma-70 factor (ECF subfamily)